MIVNYTEPQLTIDQILAVEIPSLPRQAAVIVGAQYVSPSFESKFDYQTFSSDGSILPLSFTDSDESVKTVDSDGLIYKLDPTSVDVLVENAEFDLFTDFDEEVDGIIAEAGVLPTHVITNKNLRVTGTGSLWPSLYGRPVSIGDSVYCYNADGVEMKRKVTGFIGKLMPSEFGTGTANGVNYSDNLYSAGSSNPILTTIEGNPYEVYNYITPPNYTSLAAGEVDPSSIRRAVNINGLSHVTAGEIKAGYKLNLRITSFNPSTATGRATVTSSDGTISTSVDYSKVVVGPGVQLQFDLSDSSNLHGLEGVSVDLVNSSINPTVGEIFSFTVDTPYEPINLAGDINAGDSSFTGSQDNTFFVKVIQGSFDGEESAILRAYDSRGTFTPLDITVSPSATSITIPLGSGMFFEVDAEEVNQVYLQRGFRKNDIYFINGVAARQSTTEYTGLILDGPATRSGTVQRIKVRGLATGKISQNQSTGTGFEISEDGTSVEYFGNLTWFVRGRTTNQYAYLLNNIGKIYTSWRAVAVPNPSEGVVQVFSNDDLSGLGAIVPGNDIAFACKIALNRIIGNSFYYLRTAGDTQEDFAEALEKIENTDLTYALAIISNNPEAFYEAIDHAQAMSAKNVKNFRRAYFGAKCPDEFVAISTDIDGLDAYATVGEWNGLNRYVTFTSDVGLVRNEIRKGDIVNISGYKMTVEQVINETELLITSASAPTVAIFPEVSATVSKLNTPANQASYISNIAKVASNRRGSLIWCDAPVAFDSKGKSFELHPKFIAAEVAAIRSITPPQLGLSRTVIKSVAETPAMYAKYKRNILNQVAANGVMIITQDNEGAEVVIRHQLTTDVNNGNLYYEDSIGVNIDNISFKVKDLLTKYVGRRNITATTLNLIAHELEIMLEDARTVTLENLDVGPQLIAFRDADGVEDNVTVIAHPVFKDRILVKFKITVPMPMNVIEVEIEAVSEVIESLNLTTEEQ